MRHAETRLNQRAVPVGLESDIKIVHHHNLAVLRCSGKSGNMPAANGFGAFFDGQIAICRRSK